MTKPVLIMTYALLPFYILAWAVLLVMYWLVKGVESL